MGLTGLAFLVAFGTGCMLAFVRHPIYGLLAYVGVFYLNPPGRWWGQGFLHDQRWSLLAAGATLLALLIRHRSEPAMSLMRSKVLWAFILFIGWIAIQSFWALDPLMHQELLEIYLKFVAAIILVCRCIDNERHLRWFLWAHVLGCFYFGWIAYSQSTGGRFDDFGGAGVGEANAGALTLVTGTFVAGSLFLMGGLAVRAGLLGMIVIIVNGIIATISRSGFLAAAIGGLAYNYFTPKNYRRRVSMLSGLALALFLLLANTSYWGRVESIKYAGEEVAGIETGAGRLKLMQTQWLMFKEYPLGCGHMCTTVLSPLYLTASEMSYGARASHNTFMTMLVDHGVPGVIFYLVMLAWIARSLLELKRRLRDEVGFLAAVLPAVAAAMVAITVGDMFVQYPKLEVRTWFIAVIMVLLHFTSQDRNAEAVSQSQHNV